ncbi:MAG: hypothetical protein U0487_00365 [Patescibacteria group bacterium]
MKENPFLADTSRLVYLVQYAERIRTQDPGLDVLIKEHSGNWFDIATRSEPKSHAELMVDATRFDDDQLMDVVQRMPDAPSGMSAAALSLAVRRLADVGFVASDDDLAAIAKAVMVYDPFRRPRHAASLAEPMIGFCLGVKSHNRIFEAVLGAFIKAVKGLPMHERGDIVLSVTKVCQYRLKGLTKNFRRYIAMPALTMTY